MHGLVTSVAETVSLASPLLINVGHTAPGLDAMGLSKQLLPYSACGADRVRCASPAKGHERPTMGVGEYIAFFVARIALMCVRACVCVCVCWELVV